MAYDGIATCLGRLSARIEHAYLVGEPPDRLEQIRLTFSTLYDSMGGTAETLQQRIAAKHQHARLLRAANLQSEARRARMAARQAEVQLETCLRMILS